MEDDVELHQKRISLFYQAIANGEDPIKYLYTLVKERQGEITSLEGKCSVLNNSSEVQQESHRAILSSWFQIIRTNKLTWDANFINLPDTVIQKNKAETARMFKALIELLVVLNIPSDEIFALTLKEILE